MKRKLVCALMAFSLCFSSVTAGAGYIYTKKSTEIINNAITYEQRSILTENGWIRAYIAYVDLSDPNAAVKVMTSSKGSSYLSTVKQMASENGAELAINGDFFNFSSSQTNMLGMTYKDGEMISSPALDNLVSLVLTDSNKVIMDYFSFTSTVTSPQGYACPIYQINKMPVTTGAITMLTSAWADQTMGQGYQELLVENDIVVGINDASAPATAMPQNGYILVTNPDINGFLNNFKIGDRVTVQTSVNPYVDGIKEASGGNTLIVADGKVSNFTNNIAGYAQRSAAGVSPDGKTLMLVATDGRQEDCRGLTQTELANLMIELGAYRAINMDGGGSTTFVSKNDDGSYTVENQVASERKVSTSIGVFSEGLVGTGVASGEIIPSRPLVVEGDALSFEVKFYDEYRNPVTSEQIVITDENGVPVDPRVYVPTLGKHTIYASCNGVGISADVEAVDSIFAIELSEETLELSQGESAKLTVFGYDYQGRKFEIPAHLVEWIENENASAANGFVTSLTGLSTVVGVKYKDKMDFVSVNKNVSPIKAPPSVYGQDSLYGSLSYGQKVAISGNVPKGATLLNRYYSNSRMKTLGTYEKAYVTTSNYSQKLPSNCLMADKYSVQIIAESLFVTINNSNKKITPSTDWSSIGIALSTYLPNIVVTAQLPIEKMDANDGEILKDMLEFSARAGKKVFFVTSGETTGMKTENGVRYITCGTVSDYLTTNMTSNGKSCPYTVFSVSGNEIYFEFVE